MPPQIGSAVNKLDSSGVMITVVIHAPTYPAGMEMMYPTVWPTTHHHGEAGLSIILTEAVYPRTLHIANDIPIPPGEFLLTHAPSTLTSDIARSVLRINREVMGRIIGCSCCRAYTAPADRKSNAGAKAHIDVDIFPHRGTVEL